MHDGLHNISVATVGMDLSNEVYFAQSEPSFSLHKDGFFREHVRHFKVNMVFLNTASHEYTT